MANNARQVRGNPQAITLPKVSSDVIEVGDLLFYDTAADAVRPATQVSGGTYAAKVTAFAGRFVGVAVTGHAAGDTTPVTVATGGDFVFVAPSGSGTDYDVGDYLAIGDGTNVQNQTVIKTGTATDAIARVIGPKTTAQPFVTLRIVSRLNVL